MWAIFLCRETIFVAPHPPPFFPCICLSLPPCAPDSLSLRFSLLFALIFSLCRSCSVILFPLSLSLSFSPIVHLFLVSQTWPRCVSFTSRRLSCRETLCGGSIRRLFALVNPNRMTTRRCEYRWPVLHSFSSFFVSQIPLIWESTHRRKKSLCITCGKQHCNILILINFLLIRELILFGLSLPVHCGDWLVLHDLFANYVR